MAKSLLSIHQLNCHKSDKANIHLNQLSTGLKNGLFVGLCQEPGHSKGKIKFFEKHLKIIQGCQTNPRACIILDKSINCIKLNQYCNEDQVAIQIKDGSRTIILSSIYLPYDSIDPPPTALMVNLVAHCRSRGWSLIVGSDANSHNTAWGSSDTNPRGDNLLYFILSANLMICNQGTVGTFVNVRREEVIDITLATSNIEKEVKNWRVINEHAFSDHRLIQYEIKLYKKNKVKPFRSVKKTNWSEYEEKVSAEMEKIELEEHPDIDKLAEKISETMKSAYEHSSPLIYGKKSNKAIWWMKELTTLKRETAKIALAYRRNPTEELKTKSVETKREYRNALHKARNEAWKKYCEEMEDKNATAKLQSIMKRGKVNDIGTLRRKDGTYTDTPQETIEELLQTLFPDDLETEEYDLSQNNYTKLGEDKIKEIVNKTTVTEALKSFKPFKSPGEDGIHPIMIQKVLHLVEPYITNLYRESIRQKRPASCWLNIKAVFIPKPGKTDYNNAKSFRPISLSSFLLKGLERVMLWYIQSDTLKKNPLNSNIFSYSEGMSTETALHRVVHYIEKSLAMNNVTIIVFLDISGAFSNTSISSLVKDLAETGVEEEILYWTAHLLKNRVVTATLGDSRTEKDVTMGTMEGGIKSPVIWNIKMSKCADKFPEKGPTKFTGYADDAGIKARGIDEYTVAGLLQAGIKVLENWAKENKLTFNTEKTKAMIFTKKLNPKKPELFINNTKIEYVDTFKYLGVTLDNKLRWTTHVENQVKKAKATIMIGRKMIGRDWGITPKTAYWLYTTTVRPILAYGAIVWINSVDRTKIFLMLQKVQRLACLMITGAMPSTPTAGMEVLLGLPPIDCYLKREALAAGVRLIHNGQWKTNPGETLEKKAHTKIIEK